MAKLSFAHLVDPHTMAPTGEPHQLSPERLTRHAVCFGMTGSGKTGLCLSLLEEVGSSGIPILAIDPKGDVANLALGFRDHSGSDFEPWVDPGEAERTGVSVADLAESTAKRWRLGLASSGVTRERVEHWVDSTSVRIYTPGSNAGIPINVLSVIERPPKGMEDDAEGLGMLISGAVTGLLGLLGEDADPVTDPRHIVLSQLLATGWAEGRTVDLEALITGLVDPPFKKVGVFPVDTFFPRKDRMALAMQLNGVLASPAFAAWTQGEPLSIDHLLKTDGGTPVRVLYLAHLDDAGRRFFVTLFLHRLVAWSRRQPGSSALRALLYFDEVMGYLPPHPKNPPTKAPVMTLMKQARAVGLGVMLCTQNPVDIDYKALSNAGSWLIGRLSTANDRKRVLEGLQGAAGAVGDLDELIDKLPSRHFLLRDIKEEAPVVVSSRWAISYLRGPLTRAEVGRLVQSPAVAPEVSAAPVPPVEAEPVPGTELPTPTPGGLDAWFLNPDSVFSARLSSFFGEYAQPARKDGRTVWQPGLYAKLYVVFDDGTDFREDRVEHRFFFPIDDEDVTIAGEPELEEGDLLSEPPGPGWFHYLPARIDEAKELKTLEKKVIEEVFRGETTERYLVRPLKLKSQAGETREAFELRLKDAVADKVDAQIAKLQKKAEAAVARLEAKRRKHEANAAKYESEHKAKLANEAVNIGETLFGMFFGGRSKSLTSAVSKRDQTRKVAERLEAAVEGMNELDREIYEAEAELLEEIEQIKLDSLALATEIEVKPISLERSDIRLDDWGLLWVPITRAI